MPGARHISQNDIAARKHIGHRVAACKLLEEIAVTMINDDLYAQHPPKQRDLLKRALIIHKRQANSESAPDQPSTCSTIPTNPGGSSTGVEHP